MMLLLSLLACGGPGLSLVWESQPGERPPVPALGQSVQVSSVSFPLEGIKQIQARDASYADLWSFDTEGSSKALTLDPEDSTLIGQGSEFLALEGATGDIGWRVATEGEVLFFAVDGEVLYGAMDLGEEGGLLRAWVGGEEQWTVELAGTPHGLAVGTDGLIFTLAAGWLYAHDADGDLVWEVETENAGYHLGLGPDVLLVCHSKRIRGYSRGTGEVVWTYRSDSLQPPAVGPDGTVYAGGDEELVALTATSGEVLWTLPHAAGPPTLGADGSVYAIVALPGATEPLWQPAVVDGATGEVLWSQEPWPAASYYNGAPALEGGLAWFAAGDHLWVYEGAAGLGKGWPRAGGDNANRRREID